MARPGSAASHAAASGATARTRRAILDAAVAVYAEDRTASLSEVARVAGVGRSTLHRYFTDRTALVRALTEDAFDETTRVFEEAALDEDPPAEAYRRLIAALFELGPRVSFLFAEGQIEDASWDDKKWEAAHAPVGALFVRGQAEGVFDPEIDVGWFIRTLWYMMSAGWEAVQEGAMPRHRAIALTTRTLEHGLLAPGH